MISQLGNYCRLEGENGAPVFAPHTWTRWTTSCLLLRPLARGRGCGVSELPGGRGKSEG